MEIKQINTGVAELLALKVPEGCSYRVHRVLEQYIQCHHYRGKEIIQTNIPLPPGNWTPLGIDTELTEEQCRELVDEFKHESYNGIYYKDYSEVRPFLATSLQSFASLMQSNGCFSVNPYGDSDATEIRVHQGQEEVGELLLNGFNRVRQQAEASTGTWLILKKENGS